jgi:hypothetical protein
MTCMSRQDPIGLNPASVVMSRSIPANTILCRMTGSGNRSNYKHSHEMIKRSMYSYKTGIPPTDDVCGDFDAGTTQRILAPPRRYAGIPASALIKLDHITRFSY